MMPGARLIRKSQCQEKAWVRYPPTVGPSVGAAVATSPMITLTPARFSGGKRAKLVAKTVGIMAPPRKPCAARNTIMELRFQAAAQSALASVKHPADSVNSTRVVSTRERKPESGIITTSAMR